MNINNKIKTRYPDKRQYLKHSGIHNEYSTVHFFKQFVSNIVNGIFKCTLIIFYCVRILVYEFYRKLIEILQILL